MRLSVTGREGEVTPEMRREAWQRLTPLARRLQRIPRDLTHADVVIERFARIATCQVRITLGAGAPDHTFTGAERSRSLARALSAAADDVLDQLERSRDSVHRREQTYGDVGAVKRAPFRPRG